MNDAAREGKRRSAALLAVTLSVAAVAVETTTGICGTNFFDPLPGTAEVAAWLFLTLTLLFNEAVLGTLGPAALLERPGRSRRLLRAAVAASGASLVVAAGYTLVFLPLLPVGALAAVALGLGFLAWAPLLNLCVLVEQIRALRTRWAEVRAGRPHRALAAAGAAALLAGAVFARPMLVGFHLQRSASHPAERGARVAALRRLHGAPIVLSLARRQSVSPWIGIGVWLAEPGGAGRPIQPEARRAYFLLAGRPAQSEPEGRSLWVREQAWRDLGQEEVERGGELVGAAQAGLSLAVSTLDGVLDPLAETVYGEWTLVFRNRDSWQHEARAEILLPEGGVVDKASLWINGQERPAAFGARAVVRKAYQEVAVVQRRDPLLVTCRQPGRVLMQCFPVPAQGDMKVRIGFSAPLLWRDPAVPRLVCRPPAIQQANFALPRELRHRVWLEGHWRGGRLEGDGWRLSRRPHRAGEEIHTARVELRGADMFRPPALWLTGMPVPPAGDSGTPRPEGPFPRTASPVDLLLVVDTGTAGRTALTPARRAELGAALAALPAGSHMRLLDGGAFAAGERDAATAWLEVGPASAQRLLSWLDGRAWRGGVDAVPALEWAWDEAEQTGRPACVVWLHAPLPAEMAEPTGLTQRLGRRRGGPALVGLLLAPGPDAVLQALSESPRIFSLAAHPGFRTLEEAVQLAAAAAAPALAPAGRVPLGGRLPALNGLFVPAEAPAGAELRPGATPADRLAMHARVLAGWYSSGADSKAHREALALAVRQRLVTPLSGAVVLENKGQYARHALSDAAPTGSIPSIPEPGTLLLLGAAGALAAVARRRRGGRRAGEEAGA